MLDAQTLPGLRSERWSNAEEPTTLEDRVVHLQCIVAMLLEKNERLRQRLAVESFEPSRF